MPRLRRVSGREAIAALEKLGFVQVRQRGSHVVLRKGEAKGDIGCAVGTLYNILKLAQVTVDEFVEKL